MSRICYVERSFSPASRSIIATANTICAEYEAQGYDLTLRQLYYQFVARGIIPNKDTEYKRLGSIINDARLAGELDWKYIEDRTRNLQGNSHWDNPESIIDTVARQYMIRKWADQPYMVEVWVEKEALAGVIERASRAIDVDYFSCRGYVSQSEMHSAALRHRRYERTGQCVVVIHLGDHDPSGIDMTRDIQDRLRLFGAGTKVERIALNMDQVEQYNPPPNPAKLTDSRGSSYVERFGDESWELDALDPATLNELITRHVLSYRDEDKWEVQQTREDTEKALLKSTSDNWGFVTEYLRENFGDDDAEDEEYE